MGLEAQIDRVTDALLRLRDTDGHLRLEAERRLAKLTDQCADVVKQCTTTSEHHAHVVGELESRLRGWSDLEDRLQRDAAWLREHAENLTEICVNTAGTAQTGIERAEARLATLEKDIHRRMDDLSRDLHAVAAQLVGPGVTMSRVPANSWSLDEVTRLHQELRNAAEQSRPSTLDGSTLGARETLALGPAHSDVESPDDHHVVETLEQPPARQSRWRVYAAVALLIAAVASAGGAAVTFYGKARLAAEQAAETERRAESIAAAATERIEAERREAAAQIAEARETATKAYVTSEILTAPDMVRFNLTGGEGAARTSAQLLLSRTRGLVFSGSHLSPLPANTVYQIWLLTSGEPVSAGTITPDTSGRVTLTTERPLELPRPVVGAQVTLEPSPGRQAPSGAAVLARVP